ncbi:MAG TPA: sugar transferase [Terriglobales bacterium]|nr:sugar transferase [Terriglobales bacterium]
MRPPVPIKPVTPTRKLASPSRLIPGAQAAAGQVPRKKSSVTVDGRFWEWQGQDGLGEPRKRHLSEVIAEAFFPRLSVHGQRWNLARQVSADFFLIIFGFAAVGHLILLLEFAIYHDPAALLGPEPFPTAGPGLLLLYGALFTLLGFSERLYHPETVQIPHQERLVLAKVVFWSAALVVAAVGWSGPHLISLTTLAASVPVNFLIMLAWRKHWRHMPAGQPQSGRDVRNVLIIGAAEVGRKLAACIGEDLACRRVVIGFLDENEPIGGDVRGRLDDLARIARTDFVDEIILTAPHQPELARRVIREARRNQIDVKVVPDLFGFEPDDPLVFEKFGNIPVVTLREERMPAFSLFLKRIVDTGTAAAILALTAPLLAIIALVIKLESPGTILYQAQRVGLKGRRFRCYKFRTMDAGADKLKEHLRASNERQGPFFKMVDDPRITRAGRFLRRYSLDELPQLWNVVCGEMSLVGPRPHPLDDFERYDLGDLQRLDVPPGLTGLWQVTARRDPSFERGLALDLEYIRSWTLWRDFQILYKTISVVLHGSGV